jgi:hypothetical protein
VTFTTAFEVSPPEAFEAITKRTAQRMQRQLLAVDAQYDRRRLVMITLNSGAVVGFPLSALPGLERAAPEDLRKIVVEGGGYGLHVASFGADISVPRLLEDYLGSTLMKPALVPAGASRAHGRLGGGRGRWRRGGDARGADDGCWGGRAPGGLRVASLIAGAPLNVLAQCIADRQIYCRSSQSEKPPMRSVGFVGTMALALCVVQPAIAGPLSPPGFSGDVQTSSGQILVTAFGDLISQYSADTYTNFAETTVTGGAAPRVYAHATMTTINNSGSAANAGVGLHYAAEIVGPQSISVALQVTADGLTNPLISVALI